MDRPEINEGEIYAGAIINADGNGHHVILLPGAAEDVTFKQAQAFAEETGGDLPNRVESALLFANCKAEFQPAWYWINEKEGSSYAWFQYFDYGGQDYDSTDDELRARAVRRSAV